MHSDSFELQELREVSSVDSSYIDILEIRVLRAERDTLRRELKIKQTTLAAIKHFMLELQNDAAKILLLYSRSRKKSDIEGKKWLANFEVLWRSGSAVDGWASGQALFLQDIIIDSDRASFFDVSVPFFEQRYKCWYVIEFSSQIGSRQPRNLFDNGCPRKLLIEVRPSDAMPRADCSLV